MTFPYTFVDKVELRSSDIEMPEPYHLEDEPSLIPASKKLIDTLYEMVEMAQSMSNYRGLALRRLWEDSESDWKATFYAIFLDEEQPLFQHARYFIPLKRGLSLLFLDV